MRSFGLCWLMDGCQDLQQCYSPPANKYARKLGCRASGSMPAHCFDVPVAPRFGSDRDPMILALLVYGVLNEPEWASLTSFSADLEYLQAHLS